MQSSCTCVTTESRIPLHRGRHTTALRPCWKQLLDWVEYATGTTCRILRQSNERFAIGAVWMWHASLSHFFGIACTNPHPDDQQPKQAWQTLDAQVLDDAEADHQISCTVHKCGHTSQVSWGFLALLEIWSTKKISRDHAKKCALETLARLHFSLHSFWRTQLLTHWSACWQQTDAWENGILFQRNLPDRLAIATFESQTTFELKQLKQNSPQVHRCLPLIKKTIEFSFACTFTTMLRSLTLRNKVNYALNENNQTITLPTELMENPTVQTSWVQKTCFSTIH